MYIHGETDFPVTKCQEATPETLIPHSTWQDDIAPTAPAHHRISQGGLPRGELWKKGEINRRIGRLLLPRKRLQYGCHGHRRPGWSLESDGLRRRRDRHPGCRRRPRRGTPRLGTLRTCGRLADRRRRGHAHGDVGSTASRLALDAHNQVVLSA